MSSTDKTVARQNRKSIQEIISSPHAMEQLPSLGVIVRELEQVASQPHVRIQEVARLIRSDQSMAVRILRLANSAYFAPMVPILDVDDALIYLGLAQVRSTILTARCIEKSCQAQSNILPWRDFWIHAVGVGFITKILSSYLESQPLAPESYYIMGLMHDIGKLVLAYLSPTDFEMIIQEASQRVSPTWPIEIEALGIDHASLGAWYLQQQGMPPSIVEPIRLHHAWSLHPNQTVLPCVLNLADRMAHHFSFGRSGSLLPDSDDPIQSREWEHYLSFCSKHAAEQKLAELIAEKLDTVPDLIQTMVS